MRLIRNHTKFTFLVTAALALVLGATLGVQGTKAGGTTILAYVNPGVQGSSATLTCTWHGVSYACGTGGDGVLDWGQSAGDWVLYKTWTYKSSGSGWAYNAKKVLNNSGCRRVRVDVEDIWGTVKGRVYYTHTLYFGSSPHTYNVQGSPSLTYSWYQLGTTVGPYHWSDPDGTDLNGCPSDGPHLHQGSEDMTKTSNGAYNTTGSKSSLNDSGNYQNYTGWTE